MTFVMKMKMMTYARSNMPSLNLTQWEGRCFHVRINTKGKRTEAIELLKTALVEQSKQLPVGHPLHGLSPNDIRVTGYRLPRRKGYDQPT